MQLYRSIICLAATAIPGGPPAYGAAGQRVSSTTGGTATAFQYDGGAVLLEKQGSSVTASYTYGNALLRKDGETPLFDGLGSERTATNGSGASSGSLSLISGRIGSPGLTQRRQSR